MTPEEAIKELRDASDNEVRYGDTEHHYNEVMKRIEALDMAIKALEKQPCEDAISREQAKDAMYALCDETETFEDNPWRDNPHIDAIIDGLDDLPSVTPKAEQTSYKSEARRWKRRYLDLKQCIFKLEEQQPYTDCVSRQEAISAIQDEYYDNAVGIDIVDIVAHLPSVTPTRQIARWERFGDGYKKCSKCGRLAKHYRHHKYCPNCGSRMAESEDKDADSN